MGYRKLDRVLIWDELQLNWDPTYDTDDGQDICYLGLAGEIATDVNITRITLPMLDREKYDWQVLLQKALVEVILSKPQRHVSCLEEAYQDFSKEMYNKGHTSSSADPAIGFANKNTKDSIRKTRRDPDDSVDYFAERCTLELNLPNKVFAMVPDSEFFGVLAINEKFVNFMFFKNQIQVYTLSNLEVRAYTPPSKVIGTSVVQQASDNGMGITIESNYAVDLLEGALDASP